jgi:CheY-like chemotaxis protein
MTTWFKSEFFSRKTEFKQVKTYKSGRLIPFGRHQAFAAQKILIRMINDSIELGATEIFIGNKAPLSFEFMVDGQSYSGSLPEEAVERVKELTTIRSPVLLDWDEVDANELRLGISRGGPAPVYCFSWLKSVELEQSKKVDEPVLVDSLQTSDPLILLVDDDARFTQILSRILEEQGFKTLVALSGAEGLVALENFNPALVITDVHMPHLSGPEFLLEGRQRGYTFPYLVLTNDEDALTEAELVLLGASAFIKKSEDPRVLIAWCRRLTGLRRVV